jgi:glucosamine--fructose-6-phosphate aminotransferase (isomerizing)
LKAASRARRRNLTTAAITNIDDSPLTRAVGQCWVTGAGAEQAIPSTKGFTAIAAASLILAFHAGEAKGVSKRGVNEAVKLITKASKVLDKWLALPDRVRSAAQLLAGAKAIALVSRNILYPVACDGALKLLEVTYIPAFAYPPEEFRHGPIAMADERFALIALTPRRRDAVLERVMEDVKASGAKVIAVGEKDPRLGDAWVEVPRVDPLATPLVYMPALQLLAHGVGEALGLPIDVPRGLKKVVGAA